MKNETTLPNPLFAILIILLCYGSQTYAQADFGGRTAVQISLADFGAIPGDNIDDSYALIKAARFIENKWKANGDTLTAADPLNINYTNHYVRLYIPPGIYDVGKQVDITIPPYNYFKVQIASFPNDTIFYKDLYNEPSNNKGGIVISEVLVVGKHTTKKYYDPELFTLKNIDGIEIIGDPNNKPIFKYADGLNIGFLDINNVPTPFGGAGWHNWDWYNGRFLRLFEFINCRNIQISNIEIDGNNQKINFMGPGDGVYQGGPHGITISAKNITLRNLYIHHLAIDGIYLKDGVCDSSTNFYADSIISEYNGRQGMTWSAGNNLLIKNSRFAHTGKAISLVQNRTVYSKPSAGLDIEYNNDCSAGHLVSFPMRDGLFENCEFINNDGAAIDVPTSEPYIESKIRSKDVLFKHCTFHDLEGSSIWIRGRNYQFDSCNIYAEIMQGYIGDSVNGELKFTNCHFEDKPYNGQKMSLYARLVHQNNIKKTLFQNCTFKINDSARQMLWINYSHILQPSDRTVFENCRMTFNGKGHPNINNQNQNHIANIYFKGQNIIENTNNAPNSHYAFYSKYLDIIGSTDPCNPNRLTLKGQVFLMLQENITDTFNIGEDNTYADFVLDDRALFLPRNYKIKIGNKSGLHILKGGSIYNGGYTNTILVDGRFAAHKGSYIFIPRDSIRSYAAGGDKLFYIDQGTNPNNFTPSPYWNNDVGFGAGIAYINDTTNFLKSYKIDTDPNSLCNQGGHNDLTSKSCAAPVYTNILCGKSKTLLYNIGVACFGNPNANNSFEFSVKGGTAPYTCTLMTTPPIVVTPGVAYTNLQIGDFPLIVKDATNCIDTFMVKIDTTLEYKILKGCVAGVTPAQFSTNACSNPTVSGPGAVSFAGNVCSVSTAGTYTITASSPTGTVMKTIYFGDCNNCSTVPDTAEWYAPNVSSSSISPDGLLKDKPIVLQGITQVDNEWFIYDNDKIFLTNNSLIKVQPYQAIVINKSKLQGCTDYWDGILADNDGERVIVNNGSTLQDMRNGVQIKNNAFIQANRSTFRNNIYSISVSNNMFPSIESRIFGNTFTGDANMFSNAFNNKPDIGIQLLNMGNYKIGELNNASTQNTFENMHTGIYIRNSTANLANSTIGIYNCKFSNIQHFADRYEILSNCYTSPKGAAIYWQTPSQFEMVRNLDVQNATTNSAISFNNCDKAIVAIGAGLTAKKLKVDSCLLGIMCNSTMNKHYVVENNNIDHSHIGISVSGEQRSASIMNNYIVCTESVTCPVNGGGPMVFVNNAPVGIKYQMSGMPPVQNYSHTIANNSIKIKHTAGIGIYNSNADSRLTVKDNDVFFITNSMNPAFGYNIRLFVGYWNENNNGSTYSQNRTLGINNPPVWQVHNSMGMYMNQSKSCILNCNQLRFTRYGFYAWGNCTTDKENITYNKCNANEFPWFFLDNGSASPGTFGNVGGANDNGNEFISSVSPIDWRGVAGINNGTDKYKVFRNSNAANFPDKISTNPSLLLLSESGPAPVEYGVIPPTIPGYTDPCVEETLPPNYITENPVIDSGVYAMSMAIVQDSVTYVNYPTVGSWIDKYQLYNTLDIDSLLLYSDIALQDFYSTTKSQTIGNISYAVKKIALLYDSTTNESNKSIRYADAVASNTLISSANQWEMNEKFVNDLWLYLWDHDIDSIDSNTINTLQTLAASCPFVEGLAVYRARTLWAMWAPNAVFDDRLLCMQWQNKNQDNTQVDIDNLIENEIKEKTLSAPQQYNTENTVQIKEMSTDNPIKLYPNPASTQVIISYKSETNGVFILYNTLGAEVLKTTLSKENTISQIAINDIANGIYHYEIEFANMKKTIGKLTILK